MRLAVIIPTLNEAQHIVHCLAPLQGARAEGHEVVVVDGGSDDNTQTLAQPFADRVLTATRGRATQMNVGARNATGDVLLFLHADCRVSAAAIATLTAATRGGETWGRYDVRIAGHPRVLRVV